MQQQDIKNTHYFLSLSYTNKTVIIFCITHGIPVAMISYQLRNKTLAKNLTENIPVGQ
jgi:hypothetical protein